MSTDPALEVVHGAAALVAPCAPFTWEVFAELTGSDQATARIPIEFPRPVEILGMRPSVIAITDGALRVPTADDLLALVDANSERRYTNALGVSGPATGNAGSFATLASLSTQGQQGRLVRIRLENAKPTMGVTFRWKLAVPAPPAPAIYEDAHIGLALFCRYL